MSTQIIIKFIKNLIENLGFEIDIFSNDSNKKGRNLM